MRTSLLFILCLFGILLVAATSHSDVATSRPTPRPHLPDPVGEATMPVPGSESVGKDPFEPYGTGPGATDKTPKPVWSYEDLSPADQVIAVRNRDAIGWDQVHDAYNTAVQERAQRAAATAAGNQLGVDGLLSIGVVP